MGSKDNRKSIVPPANPPERPDLSCSNQGLEYAIYNGPSAAGWDPNSLTSGTPQHVGKTTNVGLRDTNDIYGNKPTDPAHVAVSHRGYIYAKAAGEYTFTIPICDNDAMLWVGPKAYSGFTEANKDIAQGWVSTGGQPVAFKMTLERGKYYPIRLIFTNWGGPGNLAFEIKAPDGSVILDSTTGASEYLVRFSCDETSAPKFPPFGSASEKSPTPAR